MALSKKRQEAMASMTQKGFHFDEATHLYLLDGKPLTGVTTILSVIAKPNLIQWAADMAVTFLGWFDKRYVDDKKVANEVFGKRWHEIMSMPIDRVFLVLGEARTQHAKRKKQAGDIGSAAHAWIEEYAKAKITGTALPIAEPAIKHMTDNFVKWAEDNKVKFLQSELRVYSRKHWYAGTLDLLVEISGKIYIVDVKTGSGIYPEAFFQMAGYQIALEEMATMGLGQQPKIEGHIVLNIKKSGEFDKREYFNLEQNKDAFLAALTLYRAIESMTP